MIYRRQAFLRSYDLAPRPSPFPPLSRQKARPATHRNTEKERQLADGRGWRMWGEEPNHTTARKPGPLKNHSILSGCGYLLQKLQRPHSPVPRWSAHLAWESGSQNLKQFFLTFKRQKTWKENKMLLYLLFIQSVLNWSRQVILLRFFSRKLAKLVGKFERQSNKKKLKSWIKNIGTSSHNAVFANFWKMECPLPGEEESVSLGKEANSEADQA
jgi:hypothetical protein